MRDSLTIMDVYRRANQNTLESSFSVADRPSSGSRFIEISEAKSRGTSGVKSRHAVHRSSSRSAAGRTDALERSDAVVDVAGIGAVTARRAFRVGTRIPGARGWRRSRWSFADRR